MNEARTYPYKAWVLMPSFKPVEVEFKEAYSSYGAVRDYDISAKERAYHISEIFPSKEAAIAAGWVRIHAQEEALTKKAANLLKKREVLAKAAG
jgi:hypothetical protein